jgi:hypothetical protein
MAQSQTDICNSALQRVGAATIMNIGDNTREARACMVAYESNRKAELRKHKWRFALKRVVLAPDAKKPEFGYAYAFTLPTDCLRVCLPASTPWLDWELEGDKILTNFGESPSLVGKPSSGASPALNLQYIWDVKDPVLFDSLFYDVFCLSLAADICEAITQSTSKRQAIEQDYADAVLAAAKARAFETLPQEPPVDTWVLARLV